MQFEYFPELHQYAM